MLPIKKTTMQPTDTPSSQDNYLFFEGTPLEKRSDPTPPQCMDKYFSSPRNDDGLFSQLKMLRKEILAERFLKESEAPASEGALRSS